MRLPVWCLLLACAANERDSTVVPQPAEPPPPVLDDDSGPIAGLAMSRTQRSDVTHCTGFAVDVTITGPIDPDDRELADALALAFPSNLDFSEPTRESSKARFEAWLAEMTARAKGVSRLYADRAKAAPRDIDRVAALARVVQV